MAMIKAGTYRFNDVLTAPSDVIDQSVNFTLSTVHKSYGVDLSATCDGIHIDGDSVGMSYHVVSTVPDLSATGTEYPLNVLAYLNGWNLSYFDEGIQTITITEDTEVSAEFYDWFAANASQVKKISGCWQWKENMSEMTLPEAGQTITEQVKFQAWEKGINYYEGTSIYCNIFEYDSSGNKVLVVVGRDDANNEYSNYDGGGWWDNSSIGAARLFDFGEEEQTVSEEFYNLLTTNAVQVNLNDFFMTISGQWKWNDTINALPDVVQYINIPFISNGIPYVQLGFGYDENFGISGILLISKNYAYTVCYIDGQGWVDVGYTGSPSMNIKVSDAYKIWDFGKNEIYIPTSFHNLLTINAVDISGIFSTIKYGNEIIASPKKMAKLLTSDKVLNNDIVVESALSRPNVEPIIVAKNGTYLNSYETDSFTWDENTEYDFSVEIDGITLRCKKVENLSVPEYCGHLYDPKYTLTINSNGVKQTTMLNKLDIIDNTAFYLTNSLPYSIVWMCSGLMANSEIGSNLFENNTVYVSDLPWTAGFVPSGSELTVVAPGKKTEGFSQVVVDVPVPDNYIEMPYQYMEITENGEYDVTNYATANVNVTVPSSYMVQSLADLPNNANDGSFAIVLGGV